MCTLLWRLLLSHTSALCAQVEKVGVLMTLLRDFPLDGVISSGNPSELSAALTAVVAHCKVCVLLYLLQLCLLSLPLPHSSSCCPRYISCPLFLASNFLIVSSPSMVQLMEIVV